MPNIDKFIQAVHQFKADRLILASGQKVTLAIGQERRSSSAQAATLQQVQDLIQEIVPTDRASILTEDGEHEFPYVSASGPVLVKVIRRDGRLQVEVEPLRGGAGEGSRAGAALPVPASAAAASPPGAPATAIQALFQKMVREKCSDLHLSAGNPPLFRKDGEIVLLGEAAALSADQVREILFSIAPEANRSQFEEVHDTDFSYEMPGVARLRCNLFRDRLGPGGVFRVIPTKIPTVEDLGLPRVVVDLCDLNKGLVLVTGPTGSGKSTTLAAMIDHINRTRSAHIITIEDPIEFVHQKKKSLINQREIGVHTMGFKNALRAALREDPDIVLVGEMRDLETVAIAIETAETGHLVFGTLHTNTAPSTVDRIVDQFPADRQSQVRIMLSESLKGVITQTLLRKKGGGRIAALEILLVNSAVSNLIREGKTFQILSVMQTGKGSGMTTLSDALLDLVKAGQVEPHEAYAQAPAKAEFKALLARNGVQVAAA